jgi:hypothetical protein
MIGGPILTKTFNFNEMTLDLCREAAIFAQGQAALLFNRVSSQPPHAERISGPAIDDPNLFVASTTKTSFSSGKT